MAPESSIQCNSPWFGQTVAVVGTPAAGKTTVARAIADVNGRYVGMADLTRIARRDGWLSADQLAGTDRPDTHDDDGVLAAALRRHALTDPGSLVVLDNVVTSAASLDTFARADPVHRVRLHVVELDAPDFVLLERAQRRFCWFCQPDPDSEPHQSAPRSSDWRRNARPAAERCRSAPVANR